MFIFYVSDFFVCYSFFILITVPTRQNVHDAESGVPPKGVSGSPPKGLITAMSKYFKKSLAQQ